LPSLGPAYDARAVSRAIEEDIWPFVSRTPYAKASLPAAAAHAFRLILLSDGTGHKLVAASDGASWYYLDGSAV